MSKDKDLKDYLHRMLVPPGLRPESDDDMEKVLDLFDDGPMDSETVNRILAKSKGDIPLEHESAEFEVDSNEDCAESDELLALHRSEGDVDSEEVQKKLEEYREQARTQDETDDETDSDVD